MLSLAFPAIDPVAFEIGPFVLRWYALAYIAGIVLGWWLARRLVALSPVAATRDQLDDAVTWVTLGIILGGRLGYVLFYNLPWYMSHPAEIVAVWDGGMSFHGGVIGTTVAILYLARKEGLPWLRLHDYVACCVPFGLFFGRIANFVNAELWGAPANLPWAVRFPEAVAGMRVLGPPRHPSQLYEAGLEGLVLQMVEQDLGHRLQGSPIARLCQPVRPAPPGRAPENARVKTAQAVPRQNPRAFGE